MKKKKTKANTDRVEQLEDGRHIYAFKNRIQVE